MTSAAFLQTRPFAPSTRRRAPAVALFGAAAIVTAALSQPSLAQTSTGQSQTGQVGQPSQPGQPGRFGRPTLLQPIPVEQGIGDLNPLQTSNRLVPLDLRQPAGWDRVYRLSGDPRMNNGSGLFARISGGITAVFPWSTYEPTRRGDQVPTVPPGTTYYIGGVPRSVIDATPTPASTEKSFNYVDLSARPASPERPTHQADNSVQTSARHVLRGEAPADRTPSNAAPPSIWTSESYRRARLEQLLTRAATE